MHSRGPRSRISMQEARPPYSGFFFASPDQGLGDLTTAGIGENGEPVRRRRQHKKSRLGCRSCIARRVKCDEMLPTCKNCIKRSCVCDYSRRMKRNGKRDASTICQEMQHTPSPARNIEASDSLMRSRLLHHFEHFTSETLIPGPELWKLNVLPLVSRYAFLMDAVLTMSASHLGYLQPKDPSHRNAELQHLSKAYNGLCDALSVSPTHSNSSALISCSLLLLHHAWSSINVDEFQVTDGLDIRVDNLFPLSSGLRSVVKATFHLREASFFAADKANETIQLVEQSVENTQTSFKFYQNFVDVYNDITGPMSAENMVFATYLDGASRLVPIFSMLAKKDTHENTANLLSGIMRYLFLWPVRFQDGLETLTVQNKRASQVLLLYFYTAVSKLVSDKAWWAQERARYFCEALRVELGTHVSHLMFCMDESCHAR